MNQPNLVDLRAELSENRHLSGSLLVWKKSSEGKDWWLTDLEYKKVYHLKRNSDTEIEIREEAENSRGLPEPSLKDKVYATSQGFADWLMRFKLDLDDYDPEQLKRTDLSEKNLSFEIVHSNLLIVYEMFQEILTPPNEWFVGLPDHNIQQEIQTSLDQFFKTLSDIRYFRSNVLPKEHREFLHETFNLCDKIQQDLQQTVTYLRAKKVEQLDLQTMEQLKPQVNAIVAEALENFKRENDLSHESTKEDVAKIQDGVDQLAIKIENEIAQESISEFKEIFADQAKSHQKAAWGWLGTASILIGGVVAGIFFFGLLDVLKLEGTEWQVVLQNIFKKGSVLTLFYFALNRSIKNYTAQKHLETVNRHRENALGTFTRFVSEAEESRETRDAVLLAATNAIFNVNESGYLSTKTKGTESVNPIQQVFGAIRSSSTRSED